MDLIAKVVANLMRDDTDQSIAEQGKADGEQDHIVAEQELVLWLWYGMPNHVPELTANHGSLDQPVRAVIVVDSLLGFFVFLRKNVLVGKVVVNFVILDAGSITRMVTRKRDVRRVKI